MRSKYSVGLNVHQVFYSCLLATLVHFPYTEMIAIFEWLCGVVVSAMDLRSAACRFDSQRCAFGLHKGKSFAHVPLSLSSIITGVRAVILCGWKGKGRFSWA